MIKHIKTFISIVIMVGIVTFASAWTSPTQTPPNGNVAAPLNSGSTGQVKTGGLTVGSGSVTYGLLVPNGNVGIGTTTPTSKLSVEGSVNVTGGINLAGSLLLNGSAGTSGYVLKSQGAGTLPQWASVSSVDGGVPAKAVMPFNLATCPTGWTEFTSGRGRYIVGKPLNGTLAQGAGTALTNLENRAVGAHRHNINNQNGNLFRYAHTGGVDGGTSNLNDVAGTYGATTGYYLRTSDPLNSTGETNQVTGTNAPYIQLTLCQKD